ncbi:Uncharacterized protein TCM_021018 [Theobroma cacao]|uniref:F-box domain-containing protein n=1 Tax=Theobroma cacao TaxID=3641 RepID=A0A061EN10_THECC|nr:Uncharacterized protein TCM_021018 [Theobroma cacao]
MTFQVKAKASTFHCSSTKGTREKLDSSTLFDQVPADILRSIFTRLYIIDIVRAKAVCSSRNSLGEEILSRTPWLMLPSREEEVGGGYDVDNNVYSGFLIPGESRVFGLKKIPKEFRESCCIGSSNGWRVFLKLETTEPFLFQPFRQEKIRLPPLHGQVDILRIEGKAERDIEIEIDFDILFVMRFIGEFVDWEGNLVSEEAVFNTNIKRPTVYPYRTRLFLVYKLDFNEQKWVEMLTLGDRALFLSENQSVSVSIQSFSNCEENSIYYTDEYWDKIMDDAYSYEGHDMGIYNLKDGRVKPSYEFSFRKYSATTMLRHPKSQAMPENSNSPQQLPLFSQTYFMSTKTFDNVL